MGAAEGGPRGGSAGGGCGKGRAGAGPFTARNQGFEIRALALPDWSGERGRRARAPPRVGAAQGRGPTSPWRERPPTCTFQAMGSLKMSPVTDAVLSASA